MSKKLKYLTGQKFGRWTVLEYKGKNKDYRNIWLCKCDCDNNTERPVMERLLLNGTSTNCGCVRKEKIKNKLTTILINQKFGKLTVIDKAENIKTKTAWSCRCDCGNPDLIIVKSEYLKKGIVTDCGCEKEIITRSAENRFEIADDYVIGYTSKNEKFYFDLEDYEKVKQFVWYTNLNYIVANSDDGETIRLHRFVMNAENGDIVDHIRHEKNKINRDNRKSNLRFVQVHESMQNRTKFINNTSGVKGVYYRKKDNKWIPYINVNQKKKFLGRYNTLEEAAKVRKEAENKYYGEFNYREEEI